MIRLNQRGEGLISVMISVAILGVLIITIVTLYQLFADMMTKSLLRREADLVANRVRGQLMRRELCRLSLQGNVWDGTSETDIRVLDPNGATVIAQTGQVIANGRITMFRVFIRPFQIDADNDGTFDSLPSTSDVIVGMQDYRAQSGEVVIRFRPAMDAVGKGEIADRKAQVVVLVDKATNTIRDCDVNEESTQKKVCESPADAVADGFDCSAAPPAPHVDDECKKVIYAGSVDATGEPKCRCTWHCVVPIWRDRGPSPPGNVCSNNATVPGLTCPPGTIAGTSPAPSCTGLIRQHCWWKELKPGVCGPGRYLLFRATCLAPN